MNMNTNEAALKNSNCCPGMEKKTEMSVKSGVKGKMEVPEKEKLTYGGKVFMPDVDIFENGESLTLLADIPGVNKNDVNVELDKGILTIDGKIRPQAYEGLTVLYSEYQIGHFYRQFKLSEEIDEEKIEASLENGVLKVLLPKVKKAQRKTIAIG